MAMSDTSDDGLTRGDSDGFYLIACIPGNAG